MLSVNSTPEDFSLKTRTPMAELPETADIKQGPDAHDPSLASNFSLNSNKHSGDLNFNMYAEKKSESPNPLYQNTADPYMGSAPNSNTHSPVSVNVQNNQTRQDFAQSNQSHQFNSSTSSTTTENPVSAFSAYLASEETHSYPNEDLPSAGNTVVRPGSGPPGNYNSDKRIPASGYRPGSANSLLNRNLEMRASPSGNQLNNHLTNAKVSCPLSPSSQIASPADRPPSTAFVTPGLDEYNGRGSAFKPLPANNSGQIAGQQSYRQHQTPSPHLYNHGSSPSVPAGGVDYEYSNNNYRRRQNTSIDSDNQAKPPSVNNIPPSSKQTGDEGDSTKRVIVPADPMVWTREHVREWVEWTIAEYNLTNVNTSAFTKLDGAALCAMGKEDFEKISSPRNAEILMSHLNYLRNNIGPVLPNLSSDEIDYVIQGGENDGKHSGVLPARGGYSQPVYHENSTSGNRGAAPSSGTHSNVDPYQLFGAYSARLCNPGSGQIQLWQFLLELLSDRTNSHSITWEGNNGEFKMVDPDDVARRWGERKSKPNMNYDKLSRALRYYYDKNIMTKVHGKRYAYKFDFQGLAATMQPQPDQNPYSFHPGVYRGEVFNRGVSHSYPGIAPSSASGYSAPHPKTSSSAGTSPPFPPQTNSGGAQYSWHQPEISNYTSVSTLHPNHSNQSLPPTSFYN